MECMRCIWLQSWCRGAAGVLLVPSEWSVFPQAMFTFTYLQIWFRCCLSVWILPDESLRTKTWIKWVQVMCWIFWFFHRHGVHFPVSPTILRKNILHATVLFSTWLCKTISTHVNRYKFYRIKRLRLVDIFNNYIYAKEELQLHTTKFN